MVRDENMVLVKVQNKEEIRHQSVFPKIEKNKVLNEILEITENLLENYTERDENWYDNDIEVKIYIGNISIDILRIYTFSSDILYVKITKGIDLIGNKEFENWKMEDVLKYIEESIKTSKRYM